MNLPRPRAAIGVAVFLLALPISASAAAQEKGKDAPSPDWWARTRSHLSELGIEPAVAYTGEILANVRGGTKERTVFACRLDVLLDWDLEGVTSLPGHLHAAGLGIYGPSLTEETLGDVHVVSNIDAPDSVRLYEFWYEREFWDGHVSIRAGKLAADQEFLICPSLGVFLNGTFGMPTLVSANVFVPAYPLGALGVRARIESDQVGLQAAVYDGGDQEPDGTGMDFRPSGETISFVEVSIPDTWSAGIFAHSDGTRGVYTMFDTEIAPGVCFAFRLGISPGGFLTYYADFGIVCTGFVPGRGEDVLGLGVAHSEFDVIESVGELTYLAVLTPWLSIQPDVQYAFMAGSDALVLGFRFILTF